MSARLVLFDIFNVYKCLTFFVVKDYIRYIIYLFVCRITGIPAETVVADIVKYCRRLITVEGRSQYLQTLNKLVSIPGVYILRAPLLDGESCVSVIPFSEIPTNPSNNDFLALHDRWVVPYNNVLNPFSNRNHIIMSRRMLETKGDPYDELKLLPVFESVKASDSWVLPPKTHPMFCSDETRGIVGTGTVEQEVSSEKLDLAVTVVHNDVGNKSICVDTSVLSERVSDESAPSDLRQGVSEACATVSTASEDIDDSVAGLAVSPKAVAQIVSPYQIPTQGSPYSPVPSMQIHPRESSWDARDEASPVSVSDDHSYDNDIQNAQGSGCGSADCTNSSEYLERSNFRDFDGPQHNVSSSLNGLIPSHGGDDFISQSDPDPDMSYPSTPLPLKASWENTNQDLFAQVTLIDDGQTDLHGQVPGDLCNQFSAGEPGISEYRKEALTVSCAFTLTGNAAVEMTDDSAALNPLCRLSVPLMPHVDVGTQAVVCEQSVSYQSCQGLGQFNLHPVSTSLCAAPDGITSNLNARRRFHVRELKAFADRIPDSCDQVFSSGCPPKPNFGLANPAVVESSNSDCCHQVDCDFSGLEHLLNDSDGGMRLENFASLQQHARQLSVVLADSGGEMLASPSSHKRKRGRPPGSLTKNRTPGVRPGPKSNKDRTEMHEPVSGSSSVNPKPRRKNEPKTLVASNCSGFELGEPPVYEVERIKRMEFNNSFLRSMGFQSIDAVVVKNQITLNDVFKSGRYDGPCAGWTYSVRHRGYFKTCFRDRCANLSDEVLKIQIYKRNGLFRRFEYSGDVDSINWSSVIPYDTSGSTVVQSLEPCDTRSFLCKSISITDIRRYIFVKDPRVCIQPIHRGAMSFCRGTGQELYGSGYYVKYFDPADFSIIAREDCRLPKHYTLMESTDSCPGGYYYRNHDDVGMVKDYQAFPFSALLAEFQRHARLSTNSAESCENDSDGFVFVSGVISFVDICYDCVFWTASPGKKFGPTGVGRKVGDGVALPRGVV